MSTTIIATGVLCDKCHAAQAQVNCKTNVGDFHFCMHDYRHQMKSHKFQRILITCSPIKSAA